jgi:hypothetical protein
MRTAIPLTVLAIAFACTFATAPANARARVFVASYGNDANPCTFGSPCKTFQQAVNVVDPGGEVTAIDSAGFGPINITKAITITSPDGVEAGVVPTAGGDAIEISVGSTDAVVLHGLTLNGSGVGSNGIVFKSGGGLTISNCAAHNFIYDGSHSNTGNGILIQPTSGTVDFIVTNTNVSDNGNVGLFYSPTGGGATTHGVIDHVVATNNQFGIVLDDSGGGAAVVTISNSIASNNLLNGIANGTASNPFTVSIDNSSVSSNTSAGIAAGGALLKLLLSRSIITGNGGGVFNDGTATVYSYQNNQIDFNAVNTNVPLTTLGLR